MKPNLPSELSRRAFLQTAAASIAMLAVPPVSARPSLTKVKGTNTGKVRGFAHRGVDTYLGIPYGAPTGGLKRFQPPATPAAWVGERDATSFGPISPQNDFAEAAWLVPEPRSEDCLVMNVWSPGTASTAKLPVMVWLHGGAYSFGSANERIYDGTALAKTGDVVVVSINHRLNAFGYLYLGGLDPAYESSANLGQLDIVQALRWVQDNIAEFGGDPANVTLFGESGGGGKINMLLGMPLAKGLFHRAIVMSGGLSSAYTRDEATQVAETLLTSLGLRRTQLAELQAMPADRILKAIAENPALSFPFFRPVLDGTILPRQPFEPDAAETARGIPLLIGTTLDETAAFLLTAGINQPLPDEPALIAAIDSMNMGTSLGRSLTANEIAAMIGIYRRSHPSASRQEILVRLSSRANFTQSAVIQAERALAQGNRVHMYRFDWQWPLFGAKYAPHLVELPFLFGTLDYKGEAWEPDGKDSPQARAKADPAEHRYRVSRSMIKSFAAFARNGDPSTQGLSWPAYSIERRATMLINARPKVVADPDGALRAAWPS